MLHAGRGGSGSNAGFCDAWTSLAFDFPSLGKTHPHLYSRNDSIFLAAGTNEGPGPHPSAWHCQELMVRREWGGSVVLQQVSQLGVGALLPQDHIPPIRQLVQDKVPTAIPAPGGEGMG